MSWNRTSVRVVAIPAIVLVILGVVLFANFSGDGLAYAGLGAEFVPVGTDVGESGLPRRVRHVPTGIVLVLVSPGRFLMGTPSAEPSRDGDEVQRSVEVSRSFYLGETEITVGQWSQLMGRDPRNLPHQDHGELPVCGISWHRAKEFVGKLNGSGEGGWRLPSEIEWEYACRAGTRTAFSFGPNISTDQANFNGARPYADGARGLRRDRPVKVRTFPPNPWGFYEMHGNVWEWCEDPYVVHPERGQRAAVSSGAARVLRGGAWTSKGKQIRSGYRDGYPPASDGPKYGLRIVKSIAPR